MFSFSVSDFLYRRTSFIFILTVFNSLIQYSQLTQKVLNDACLTHIQLIMENIEFFFGDVPFTRHIVPQRACRKTAVVVRDWSTDIVDWESPTSEQVHTHSEQRDKDSKCAYFQFANSYRITKAKREFEFLIMADWVERTGEIFIINRIVLCNRYDSLNVWHKKKGLIVQKDPCASSR
jgi:hypothetical protein